MAQIILDSNNNLIQGDFDNATINNRTKFKTTTTNATTNVYAVPNGSATSAGFTVTNAADPTNASKLTIATNGSTDTQIISGVNGSGTYLPLSFYTNNTLAMQIGTNGQVTVAATANPAFSAYANASQTIATATATKIAFQTEVFDTNNNFDSTTNYRFTPTIAGYYQFNASLYWNATLSGEIIVFLYKNGAAYVRLFDAQFGGATAQSYTSAGTNLAYANGSTDYFEIYGYQSSGSSKSTGNQSTGDTIGPTYFQGFLARSA